MAALTIGVVLQSAVIAAICVRGAAVSIKTTILLMLIEISVVLALSATVLWVKGGQPGGINLHPFDPAYATQGFSGFWAAIILGILAFSGFDVVATAAEEAQAPREHVPRVLIFAILVIGFFWALTAWVLTLSAAPDAVARYNAQGLSAITPVARTYWGGGNLIVIATAFTGLTAIYISCVQGASRLVFSMARQGLLPRPFARLAGAQRVPRNAILAVVTLCIVMGLLSLAFLRDGLDSFVWWSSAMVFFAALTFTGVNVANILYFRRILPEQFRVVRNLLVPVWGIAVSLYLLYAAFFSALWSAPFRTGRSIVIVCLVLFVLELAAATWMRVFRRDLFSASSLPGSGFEDAHEAVEPRIV